MISVAVFAAILFMGMAAFQLSFTLGGPAWRPRPRRSMQSRE
jgi:hypothetical protein